MGSERAKPGPTRTPARGSPVRSTREYLGGARVLSVAIAATGLLTFAYFSIASHVLGEAEASRLDVLWSVMFVTISVIYRPIEQLLSRSIAEHRAHGRQHRGLGAALSIQGLFALAFLAVALLAKGPLVNHVFDGSEALYWVLVLGTLAYAASYFARGWLAGHERFGLYGGLVLTESFSRVCFVLAVALGVASGQTAVALGIAAAPALSLLVVPGALRRAERRARDAGDPDDDLVPVVAAGAVEAALAGPGTEGAHEASAEASALSLRRGGSFAAAVSGIMISEQALLNVAVLTVAATATDKALAGIVFNVFLIARAPLQLFQAIQTTLLPHLTGLEVNQGHEAFRHAIRLTARAIGMFAAAVAVGLLAVGPAVMEHALFGQDYSYGRVGLALMGVGMGMHLLSGTLNQAALARSRERAAAACWAVAAAAFTAWMLLPVVSDQLTRAELGYLGATSLLAAMLALLYRQGARLPRIVGPAGVATGDAGRVVAEGPTGRPAGAPTGRPLESAVGREPGASGPTGSYTLDLS